VIGLIIARVVRVLKRKRNPGIEKQKLRLDQRMRLHYKAAIEQTDQVQIRVTCNMKPISAKARGGLQKFINHLIEN
jgi:hypothetical protein